MTKKKIQPPTRSRLPIEEIGIVTPDFRSWIPFDHIGWGCSLHGHWAVYQQSHCKCPVAPRKDWEHPHA